jgi:hypothetical protein
MVPDGTMLLGHARGELVFLVRRGDELFATGAICTHYDAPLEQGLLVGDTVRRPWLAWSSVLAYAKELGFPCSWCTQGEASQASNRQ